METLAQVHAQQARGHAGIDIQMLSQSFLSGHGNVSCFQRDREPWVTLGPAEQEPHQPRSKASRTNQGVVAKFNQKSQSPDKFIVMNQAQGQARSKYKSALGSVMANSARHSPVVADRSIVITQIWCQAKKAIRGSGSRLMRSIAQHSCTRDQQSYSIAWTKTKVPGLSLNHLLSLWAGQGPQVRLISAIKAISALRALTPSQFTCIFLPLHLSAFFFLFLCSGIPQCLWRGHCSGETFSNWRVDLALRAESGQKSTLFVGNTLSAGGQTPSHFAPWASGLRSKLVSGAQLLGCPQPLRQPRLWALRYLSSRKGRVMESAISCSVTELLAQ